MSILCRIKILSWGYKFVRRSLPAAFDSLWYGDDDAVLYEDGTEVDYYG
jgi:hypothetical protein